VRRRSGRGAFDALESRALMTTVLGTQVLEGDTSQRVAEFKIVLAHPSPVPLTFNFTTGGGIATANMSPPTDGQPASPDYIETKGTVTFAPRQTMQEVPVPVIGDTLIEHDENFFLVVWGNGRIAFGEAIIIDDDPKPGPPLHVSNPRVIEGDNPIFVRPPVPDGVNVNWNPAAPTPAQAAEAGTLVTPFLAWRQRHLGASVLLQRWAIRTPPGLR
jgi:hypothetical protein